jgi:hypothetical protein
MKNHPIGRKDNLVVQNMDGEILIYDLNINKAFCLNETSALIWQECDGSKSVAQISESISRKLNSPLNEDFVWLALDQLKEEKLIANSEEIAPNFNGMSRREVIKKVGLASVVALPLVSGLVAPPAVAASSVCVAVSCQNNQGCASQPVGCRTCGSDVPGQGRICGPA